MLLANLKNTIDSDFIPMENLIQNLLLEKNIDFQTAV